METQELKKTIIELVDKMPDTVLRELYELLTQKSRQHASDEEVDAATNYILKKNAELYRRLA
ncbi:hypothetical protein BWI97_16405 [Siphonobacter sp. BAB-5405]|uniref:hypothetical protein n=1 Tax=Siphonobacter sp. BAB-5405 TaxID=1864825 RepID=UPI000C80F738|nr:hypothetical protein [Siphonobacter sp. BAB-5405]PMD94549.1 hypothetical protein BWI97_16405 [Siphonobacter sp. BAB-5405]